MSFCPYCGALIKSATEPAANCPACGRPLPSAESGLKSPGYKPPQYLKDAAIALAILVLLVLLWRVLTRPDFLGGDRYGIRTKIFGPSGIRVSEILGESQGSGDSSLRNPNGSANDLGVTSTNATNITSVGSNPTRPTGSSVASDDTLITNRPVKAIVNSPTDFSYTNEPAGGSTTSADAASLAQRLSAVGAKSGDVEFSLSWNNFNDLDLHCIDPRGVEIWYSHTRSELTGGELDHDANIDGMSATPVENIYWPVGGAPAGIYNVFVVYYAPHGSRDPTQFTVRTVVKGQTNYFAHNISYTGIREKYWICSIMYDPRNPDPVKQKRFMGPGATAPR